MMSVLTSSGSFLKHTYSDDLRELIYKLNPQHMSCIYKQIFEAAASMSLRKIDCDDTDATDKDAINSLSDQLWATPVLDSSIQKTDGSSSVTKSLSLDGVNSGCHLTESVNEELHGWDVCQQLHTSYGNVYKRDLFDLNKLNVYSRSQSACAKFDGSGSPTKAMDKPKSKGSGTKISSSCEIGGRTPSDERVPSNWTMGKIHYEFKNFSQVQQYIEQYREEYTYPKLRTPKSNISNSGAVRYVQHPIPIAPVRCFDSIRCYSSPSQLKDKQHIRKMPRKKITRPTPVKSMPSEKRCKSPQTGHNGVLRMEFHDNPLSVNNPTTAEISRMHKMPIVCRSRPTIPSNAHGAMHPCSIEQTTYNLMQNQKDPDAPCRPRINKTDLEYKQLKSCI